MEKILITGSAGFIGFHVAKALLKEGHRVVGVDNLNDYYDPKLKIARNQELMMTPGYEFHKKDICNRDALQSIFQTNSFTRICHLAAQAGVRYSIENPYAYQESNLGGFLNIIECARQFDVTQFVYASSSSVYGNNEKVPFSEDDQVIHPISLYAATKRANELMAYTYSHLYKINTIGLRFFTVYGPWGRPDMAYFKFTKSILNGDPIKVFNNGELKRDFTYIEDIVPGVIKALWYEGGSDILNLGNNSPEKLMDFIAILESKIGKKAEMDMVEMQAGDVNATFADIEKSKKILAFSPKTKLEDGLGKFVDWYKLFYGD